MLLIGRYPKYPIRLTNSGERAFDTDDAAQGEPLRWWQEPRMLDGGPYEGPYFPDLDDPATLGCVEALLIEAWKPVAIRFESGMGRATVGIDTGSHPGRMFGGFMSRGEALVAALEAAPVPR